jgi:small-conductance mechanosensitive channel
MWCLETIVDINKSLASGRTLDEAYRDNNIRMPFPKRLPGYQKPPEKEETVETDKTLKSVK